MEEKNLIIICITAIICVAIIAGVILYINNSNQANNTTNNTTNNTINVTINDTNNTNNTTTTTKKTTTKKSSSSQSSQREEDKITPDGWDPKKHEVSRQKLDDNLERVSYDDGYFRVVDKKGNVLSYGY